MGIWTTFKQRQQQQGIHLRVLNVDRLTAPVGALRGRLTLEAEKPAEVELVFRLVREVLHEENGAEGLEAITLATVRNTPAIALRPREPVVVEFQVPYNFTGLWPLAWRLPASVATGESFFLEAQIDAAASIPSASDRMLLILAAP